MDKYKSMAMMTPDTQIAGRAKAAPRDFSFKQRASVNNTDCASQYVRQYGLVLQSRKGK